MFDLPKKYMTLNTGTGGGSISFSTASPVSATVNMYPTNTYWDAGNPTVGQILLYESYSSDLSLGAINYYITTLNNISLSSFQKIDKSGNYINTTAYSWSYPVSTSNIDRLITGLGRQSDKVDWFDTSLAFWSTTSYNYIVLQKAVPVLYATIGGGGIVSILPYNANTTVTTGENIILDATNSRGNENGYSWTILKTDPNGTFNNQTAVVGVDYNLVSGTLSSGTLTISFITNYNFTIKLSVSGYTFASNPYNNYPLETTPNTTVVSYNFNTAVSSYDYDITFPTITPVLTVPTVVTLGTSPFETYQNQLITVTPTLNLSTGSWLQYPTGNTSSKTPLTKTDQEWRDEINAKLNVVLEVRETTTGNLLLTSNGLNPYTVVIQTPNLYNFQIKISLK